MIGHALLFFVAASKERTEKTETGATFSPQHFLRRGAVVHFEDVDRKAGPTESLAT